MLNPTLIPAFLAALGLPAASPPQPPPRQTESGPTFFVTGRGWGHGVGMSQYGALGYAQRGAKVEAILAHYYPGTTLGSTPARKVRVLLASGKRRVNVSSKQPFQVKDADGNAYTLEAGSYALGPGLKLKVDPAQPPQALPAPLAFSPGAAVLALNGRAYRGTFQVTRVGSGLQVVNVVGLELYLDGVVSAEMPRTWPVEALKAQAVVARSYALGHLQGGGSFDLYPDTRSQVYRGVIAESPPTNAAVGATAGRILQYRGRVASTYFFSTSGGRTAAVQDVWPSAQPLPYLVSVADPYDSISPYHEWGPLRFAPRFLGRRLGAAGRLLDVQTTINSSGRVRLVALSGSRGDVSLPGADVRRLLGLRSTWFRVGVLSIAAPAVPVVQGSQVKLTGLARGVPAVELQERPYAGSWRKVTKLTPGKEAAISSTLKPAITTAYRLAVGSVVSNAIRLSVSPLVRFYPLADRSLVKGFVRPVLAGAPVQIQRLDGSAWTTVARAVVDPNGDFQANFTVAPGTYRARTSARPGFAAGTSAVLRVIPA